jgi:DNA-binding LytR/AlgR family response regulator
MNILIIEDEALAARNLASILDDILVHRTYTMLESIAETLEWFEDNEMPDLIFMDIHLADGSAFVLFNHIKISCPIIFTTAYDTYALQAFKVNSIDYLLKPITREAVARALDKLESFSALKPDMKTLKELLPLLEKTREYRKSFLVHQMGDKLIPLKVEDIAIIIIDAGIVRAVTFEQKTFSIDHPLDELEFMLNPTDFFRANRQMIVARNTVNDIELWFNGRLSVNLKIELSEQVLVSKARASEFKAWLTN